MSVQAESVDVLMVVSGMEADEAPITTSCKIKIGNESIQLNWWTVECVEQMYKQMKSNQNGL